MNHTIGIFAHVDSGKTTLTEQILYRTGRTRNLGRVDDGTSSMDCHTIERNRGITVFTDQSTFEYAGNTYAIIDTPGHVDFSLEAERSIQAIDFAILLVSATEGVQSHTLTISQLLAQYQIPTLFFISKTDLPHADVPNAIQEIAKKVTSDAFFLSTCNPNVEFPENIAEFAAERNESFLDAYLSNEWTPSALSDTLQLLVKNRLAFPILSGSGRTGDGMDGLLHALHLFTPPTPAAENAAFSANVYKVRYDEKNTRITYLKINSGTLHARDEFCFLRDHEIICEKVSELQIYHGIKFQTVLTATAGQIVGVTGLQSAVCGMTLSADPIPKQQSQALLLKPALLAQLIVQDDTDPIRLSQVLRILEAEDPALAVTYHKATEQFLIHIMGRIQLEVLEQTLNERFSIAATFAPPQIEYRETIASPVTGIGHFEPLRHYAEVQLRLEPTPRGTGITFCSECPTDILSPNYQHLVEAHVFEKTHLGVLTGSPLTDVRIVLLAGLAHEKHTEGGDFREATYRAIRQALCYADSVLLEPFYSLDFYITEEYIGKILSDIQRLHGTFEAPKTLSHLIHIRARGPVSTFLNYAEELEAFTKGTGSVRMIPDGFDLCQNACETICIRAYNPDRDTENPTFSVFCSHGSGFSVPWNEVQNHSHILRK